MTRQQAAASAHPSPPKEGEGNYSRRLLAARNADDAGPGHFDQADVTHQVDERIYLLRPASNLKNEAVDRRVDDAGAIDIGKAERLNPLIAMTRSEEHTSELQSLMRISYAVLGLKK